MRSFRRKTLDRLQRKYARYYHGVVLDIGGRNRGKFKKPKEVVEKWIFADISPEYDPDIIVDVADMKQVKNESIDVVNAVELFEHVKHIDRGLDECERILKIRGIFIISVPFLYPVHADPNDYQRWTQEKWIYELKKRGFTIRHLEITGYFFSVLATLGLALPRSLPKRIQKPFLALFYPMFLLLVQIDRLQKVKKSKVLSRFHDGYFIVAEKLKETV